LYEWNVLTFFNSCGLFRPYTAIAKEYHERLTISSPFA
jgi:hypothetical protein